MTYLQVDKRGLPLPSPSAFSSGTGMLRGLLMRRQSSQVSTHGSSPSLAFDDETSVVVSEPLIMEAAYGDPSQDAGDEVRFSVELTRLDRLNDTYSLDIRRLKGNLRSYKFLYDTLREYVSLFFTVKMGAYMVSCQAGRSLCRSSVDRCYHHWTPCPCTSITPELFASPSHRPTNLANPDLPSK